MIPGRAMLIVTLHSGPDGWWASEDTHRYTAAANDPVDLLDLVHDAAAEGFLGGDPDVRWVACQQPGVTVVAFKGASRPTMDCCEASCTP